MIGNSIHLNDGLGIDLGTAGVTPNDGPGDADNGANGLQNFPVISSVAAERRQRPGGGSLKSAGSRPTGSSSSPRPRATRAGTARARATSARTR